MKHNKKNDMFQSEYSSDTYTRAELEALSYDEIQRNLNTHSEYAKSWVRDSAGCEEDIIRRVKEDGLSIEDAVKEWFDGAYSGHERDYSEHDVIVVCAFIRHCIDDN